MSLCTKCRSVGVVGVAGFLVVAAILAGGATAQASIIVQLSQASTTPGISPDVLDARLQFDLSGSVLTLTAYNDTADPNAYYINSVFFNATSNVTGLALTSPDTGWSLAFSQTAGTQVGALGTFDAALEGGVGNSPNEIAPGASEQFQFTVTGADLAVENFIETSDPTGDNPGSIGAAKFIRGPGDGSSNGGGYSFAPEPATLALLGLGLVGTLVRRRRA